MNENNILMKFGLAANLVPSFHSSVMACGSRRKTLLVCFFAQFLLLPSSSTSFAGPNGSDTEPVGRFGQNQLTTPVNQLVTPAGRLVDLPGLRPQALALSPN